VTVSQRGFSQIWLQQKFKKIKNLGILLHDEPQGMLNLVSKTPNLVLEWDILNVN